MLLYNMLHTFIDKVLLSKAKAQTISSEASVKVKALKFAFPEIQRQSTKKSSSEE